MNKKGNFEGEMVQKPTATNGSKYVYRVTNIKTGQYKEGYGDTPSDAVCNCQLIADIFPESKGRLRKNRLIENS